jgi:DNA repair exonuclease SbcCD nuclease subunit
MLKFLHAADIHLDSPLRGLERYDGAPVAAIRGASRRAFANLVTLALEEPVDFVLLAGDLYDGDWKDYNTGLFFAAQMGRLRQAGIAVYLIAGNHDAASQISKVLRPPDNVHVLSTARPETRLIESLGVAIHGQGFAHQAMSEDLTLRYPEARHGWFNIGLLHTSLDGRPGHARYAPTTVDRLRSLGYQYWALGHVHQREVVATDPPIVYPGNLQGRQARESGAKGATLVTVGDHGATLEARVLDVFRWSERCVDVSGAATAGVVLDRVRAALEEESVAADGRPLAIRLRLAGRCAAHREMAGAPDLWREEVRAVANGLGGDAPWIERVVLDTQPPGDAAAALGRQDALGGLLRSLAALEASDDEAAALALSFTDLRSKLPAELFAAGDGFDPSDPQRLRDILSAVKDLLIARLAASHEVAPP